jgi:hypothetical protein
MDPVTLASMAVAALSPLVAKGMEELSKTVFMDVYTAIKERLSGTRKSKEAVEQFEQDPGEGAPAFQAVLADQLAQDKELMRLLADALEKSGAAPAGSLVGKIEAEKVVVANKIDTVNM